MNSNRQRGRIKATIYLEPDVKEKLQEWADAEHRSLSGQIVYLLEHWIAGMVWANAEADKIQYLPVIPEE